MILVNVEAMMERYISSLPWIAEGMISSPPSLFRRIFSNTTIELSTSIPAPNAIPKSVITLMVRPAVCIKIKVPTIDTGIGIVIMMMDRKRGTAIKQAMSARK